MKCPKCGFVSYPGLSHCKKCGHSFSPSKHRVESPVDPGLLSRSLALAAEGSAPDARAAPSLEPQISPELTVPEPRGREPGVIELSPSTAAPEPTEPLRPWREELSERVENFRRRRARLKGGFDPSLSLEFDFPGASGGKSEAPLESREAEPEARESELDFELDHSSALEAPSARLDSLTLDHPAGGLGILQDTESEIADALPLPAPPLPVEIVLDSPSTQDGEAREAVPMILPLAPMGRRFLGGLVDALVLLVSAGLFALIYWRAGGRLTPNPLNLAVVGFIGVLISLAYFGVFTVLTSTTPGLLWVGIEVRNLQGNPPTPRQACWRAFGYLVSTSALLLGFVWALVDSEGLTWHDRMSDTFLASADSGVQPHTSRVAE